MTADMAALKAVLSDGDLALGPLAEAHREGLRAACAADPDIWRIYPYSMAGDAFDPVFARKLAEPGLVPFAVEHRGAVAGTTSYLSIDAANHALEIGATFIAPDARGTGLNARMKRLMIDHAIACGFTRIEFRIDTRNARSMAAVAKLGASREGVLRKNRITWTGHVRDTAVFSILAEEWRAVNNR